MEPRFEALSKLFENSETAQKLLALSPDEAVTFLKENHNLEFTSDELNDVATGIKDALQDNSDELNSDQLDMVSGGGKDSTAYSAGYYIGKTVKVVGTVAGIAGFAIAAGLVSW